MVFFVVISITGAVAIQPTILYLTTCILGEFATNKASTDAALRCFTKMTSHRLNSDPRWEKYLLSTLAKLLDMSKTGGDDNSCASEDGTANVLSAITLFIKYCAPHLIKIPNLLYPSINLYQQALQSSQDHVI